MAEEDTLARMRKFLHAYATGDCLTFVNPQNGKLLSVTDNARALAAACLLFEKQGTADMSEKQNESNTTSKKRN